ncbi:MAG: Tyrosine recombinase XerA [Candidatus Woesearchaeota archaeon]|nr:Tyrosine recombinase XerA [Candidatus Woesearchaeota archaeon]
MKKHIQELETELKLRGFSKNTIKSYVYHNKRFLNYVGKSREKIQKKDIKKYVAYLISEKELAASSIGLIIAALKFYYNDVLDRNIVNLKAPKVQKKLPTVLSKEEISKLIKCAKSDKSKLLIKVLYSAGLRLSEALALKVNDLELESSIGWVRSGKGGKDRLFILSDSLCREIQEYIDDNQIEKYIFLGYGQKPMCSRNAQKIVKRASLAANIRKKVSPHTLRHTFATHLLESGVGIRQIQELLGHANLQTTQIYTKVSTAELMKIKNPLDDL